MNAPLAALAIPYDAIEAIVVDDGSTDGTAGILEAFTAGNHRVRILRQEDQDRYRGFPIPRDDGGYVPESRRLSTAEAFGSMLERAENSTSSLFFGMKTSDGLNQFV